MVSSLKRKSTPARSACAPARCDRLLTAWYSVFSRLVGLLEKVPKVATPAIVTCGPIWSVEYACRSPWAICTRVSLTVFEEIVQTLLIAIEWSRLSSPVDPDGAFRLPTPRALSEVTS